MMASRAARVSPYTFPHFYSPRISFTSRFRPHQFPASHVTLSQFRASAPKYFHQGTHHGPSMWGSPGWPGSTPHIQNFFLKCWESQRWLSEKIKAISQTNLGLALTTIFAGSVVNVVYTQYHDCVRERGLNSALATGAVPDIESEINLVERQGATSAIELILKPPNDYARYNMIVGNHGTGKTTLVRHVGHKLNGIIYVNIRPNRVSDQSFAEDMAKAVHWTPATHFWLDKLFSYWGVGPTAGTADDRPLLDMVFREFENRAKIFKKKNGRSPVLVLDNVNRLAQDNPKLLSILQDMAKDAADDRLYITVFVTSDGQAPIQMLARSSSSRLGKVMEIGDLNHDEAINFLCNNRGISKPVAQDIYNLVGGRVGLLVSAINELESGQDLAGVRASLLSDAKNDLRKAGMDQEADSEFRVAGLKIANHILELGRINLDDFYRISGSKSQGDKLLSINVFTNVPRTQWVLFHTKPMQLAVGALLESSESGSEIAMGAFPEAKK